MKIEIVRYSFHGEYGLLLSEDREKISLRNVEINEKCTRETSGDNSVDYNLQVEVSFNCTEPNKFYTREVGKDTCVCPLYTVISFNSDDPDKVIVRDVSLHSPNYGIGSFIQRD